MHCPKVFLPGAVGAASPNNCVDDLSVIPSSISSWRILPSRSMLRLAVVFLCSRRSVVSPSCRLFPSWEPLRNLAHCTSRRRCPTWISSSILSFSAWHSSVVCPLFLWYKNQQVWSAFSGLAALLGSGINSALKVSSKIFPLSAFKGVYLVNWCPRLSLRLSP